MGGSEVRLPGRVGLGLGTAASRGAGAELSWGIWPCVWDSKREACYIAFMVTVRLLL